mmetsp:Transcript_12790/g.40963  ORF Transcript_12790/g.40963 Transcript_12790/m.40963 type:complete len:199 (+) Transcript_12790:396-992(+)
MPEGAGDMRSFMRENVMDVFYYLTTSHGQRIIDAVADQLTSKYRAFVAEHPGFSGGVSIFGHSFGTIITYDLLTKAGRAVGGVSYPVLPFPVDCFFACGSPAALFLVSRRHERSSETADKRCEPDGPKGVPRPSCDAYFNIWSRADPVSWKVEPLLPPPTRDGVLVASRATRDWVTKQTRPARSRLLPAAAVKCLGSV